jgi:hypothetical protein
MRFDSQGGWDTTIDEFLEWLFGVFSIAHTESE